MNRIIKSDLSRPPKKFKKMNKIEQPVRFEPKNILCGLVILRYRLSYLDFKDQLCIYPAMKGKSHNFVNKT